MCHLENSRLIGTISYYRGENLAVFSNDGQFSGAEKSGVEKSGVEKSGVEKSGVEKSGVEKK